MKIGLYLGVAPQAGGMFQYAQAILEALRTAQADGHELVIAYGPTDWQPILQAQKLNGVALTGFSFGQTVSNILMTAHMPIWLGRQFSRFGNPIIRQLEGLACDVWLFPAQEALAFQMPCSKSIATIHDLMHRYEPFFPEASGGIRKWVRDFRFANLARNTHAVLVDSEIGKQHVIESYGAAPATIHPLPYCTPSYIVETINREGVLDPALDAGLPSRFLFYPAQFWPHKNHARLFEALKQSLDTCPDMHLVLSGHPAHEYDNLHELASSLGIERQVQFIGRVEDRHMAALYQKAMALIMPTFFGPTNIPPLEAMATQTPSLLSGIYAMQEQSGEAALYFDPTNVSQIAETMQRFWRDEKLQKRLTENAAARAPQFTQAAFCKNLTGILARMNDG